MSSSKHAYRFDRFEIRPVEREIFIDGLAGSLGARAFDMLLTLIEHRDRVVSGKELMDTIWPGRVVEDNNLRQQVSALRKVLSPQVIITIPARGYRFGMVLDDDAPSTLNGAVARNSGHHAAAIRPLAEMLDDALAATERALELDDQNAVFYMLKARVQVARCEYDSALIENEMAISLNPTLAAAHCSLGDTLAYLGRYEEALVRFEKALELSPRDPQRWAFLTYGALALIFKRDFETAVKWTHMAGEIPNHQYWTAAHKAVALAYLGRHDEARVCTARLLAENPAFTRAFAERKLFYLKQPTQLQMYLAGLSLAGVR